MMPMITSTTSTSSSVKPGTRRGHRGPVRSAGSFLDVPVADVRIGAFAALLVVGAEGVEVVVAAACAGRDVGIVVAPRILLQRPHIAARFPVADVRVVGLLDQRLEPLLGGGVAEVVHPVEIERRFERADVLL